MCGVVKNTRKSVAFVTKISDSMLASVCFSLSVSKVFRLCRFWYVKFVRWVYKQIFWWNYCARITLVLTAVVAFWLLSCYFFFIPHWGVWRGMVLNWLWGIIEFIFVVPFFSVSVLSYFSFILRWAVFLIYLSEKNNK